jgi:nucleotide-binding universal stress UspA family protein
MFRTILLYLPSKHGAEAICMGAALLAAQQRAVLIGAHNTVRIRACGGIPTNILAEHDERERRHAQEIRSTFEEVARGHDLAHAWRDRPLADTDAYRDIIIQSHAVDLIVAPGRDVRDPLGQWYDLPERLAMESGRPILLLPREPPARTIGQHVLVAWNGTREAARAAFDAMPLLCAARQVSILTLADRLDHTVAATAEAFTAALARHGVAADLAALGGTRRPDGEALLSHLEERGCDLLVMGFYGHSRSREIVFGGVTRHVLGHMSVPVFTAH